MDYSIFSLNIQDMKSLETHEVEGKESSLFTSYSYVEYKQPEYYLYKRCEFGRKKRMLENG